MRTLHVCASTTADSRAKIWYQLKTFQPPPPVVKAAVRSKAVILLFLIRC